MAAVLEEVKNKAEESTLNSGDPTLEKESKRHKEELTTGRALFFSKRAPKISFEAEGDGLAVTIETERLHMRSVRKHDLDSYAGLYGDIDVMGKFATGVTKDKEFVQGRINAWAERWGKKDPFSSLAVFKQDSDDLVGQVVLGYGEKEKESELAYLFNKKYWRQGIGTESVAAVVQDYAPQLAKQNFKVNGQPFESIVATARIDNPGSFKILETVGMTCEGESEKFGGTRKHYRKKIA